MAGMRVVVGLGASGRSVVNHLRALGQPVSVMDTREQPPGLEALGQRYPDLDILTGRLDAEKLCQASEIVISPGVPLATREIQAAMAEGVPVIGDIDLFARAARAPVIAITGSNAKSTVTTLVGEMLAAAGIKAAIGGNLGLPALSLLDNDIQCYVLELSSFQLETLHDLAPAVAVFLNLSQDHLDRYEGCMSLYLAAKQKIYDRAAIAVWNRDDPATRPGDGFTGRMMSFGLDAPGKALDWGVLDLAGERCLVQGQTRLLACQDLQVSGSHNEANVLASLAAVSAMEMPVAPAISAATRFRGLAHRCERVDGPPDVTWINDSKATNPGATLAAVSGLADRYPVTALLLGGDGKGADFESFAQSLKPYAGSLYVILYGRDGPIMRQPLCEAGVRVEMATGFEAAIAQAHERARPGGLVLLSPACASFDMFDSFEHRGDRFRDIVGSLC
jgi:UDP-N-acetylmuramoylalanine--D-glutamate ligase